MTTKEVRSKLAQEIKMWRRAGRKYRWSKEQADTSVFTLRAFALMFSKEQPNAGCDACGNHDRESRSTFCLYCNAEAGGAEIVYS